MSSKVLESTKPGAQGAATATSSGALASTASPEPNVSIQHHAKASRILVVDDDPRSARLLVAGLSSVGRRVTQASTAEDAQAVFHTERPDLLVCDVCLPGMNGVELTGWIRADEQSRETPILLVTTLDDRKILARSLEAGADDFLTKPINTLELGTRVRSLLRNKSLMEELRAYERDASPPVARPETRVISEPTTVASESFINPLQSTILVVEDDQRECRLIETHLSGEECRLRTAHGAQSALAELERDPVDLVLLDLVLPDCTGYTIIEHMRNSPRHVHTPILVVSALSGVEDRVKALELGADDFILKGAEHAELQARIRRLLRRKRSLDQLAERCDHALRQAVTDSLTGFYTHGFLQETLQRQIAFARRFERSLSVLFLDIDHFKQINDRHGHAIGDDVLRRLAQSISTSVREVDVCVRYGGEEFVVLLPHTSSHEALKVAERIRLAAETLLIPCPQLPSPEGLRLTVSIGVAGLTGDINAATLLQRADEAMYIAKRAGRNQVAVFGEQEIALKSQGRILLVDDDDRNLRLLEAYLAPEGYTLLKARRGMEALEMARREQPDLVLLDGMMPQVSGFDVCRRLKQETCTTLIPVVIVTALRGREDRLRGIEAGADDFLTKPVDRVELLARTRALLRAKRTTDTLEDAESVVLMLAKAVERRDPSTGGHVERVSHYAVALGRALGLPGSQIDALRRAGIVHDIGKISIPDVILLKPGKLTPEEREVMQTHVEVGYEMLQSMRTFRECLPAVRYHHERLDGSGYPHGLRGEQIPLMAQIMGMVDVFDALATDRVYRPAMSYQDALDVLQAETDQGLHDPELFDAFRLMIAGTFL